MGPSMKANIPRGATQLIGFYNTADRVAVLGT